MSTTQPQDGSSANAEAIAAWDGPLFERFVRYRHIVVAGPAAHGDEAIRLYPPATGDRVLDLGCGFGETTRRLAALTEPTGFAVGVDASHRFIEIASREAGELGASNVGFAVGDVEIAALGDRFDLAFSRFGTMFFANPVAALRNVCEALVPGGRLVMVVWRAKAENPWAQRPEAITEQFVTRPERSVEPTCDPGPFSMADADMTSAILESAGFEEISLRRCDLPITLGADLDEAVELVMALGPAGEILRLAGERAAHLHAPIAEALREGMREWAGPDGVTAPASTWIVSAVASPAPATPRR